MILFRFTHICTRMHTHKCNRYITDNRSVTYERESAYDRCCWVSCTDLKGAGEIERRGSRPQRFLGNGFLFSLASHVCNLFIRLGDITSGVCDTLLLQRSSFTGTIAQMGVKCSTFRPIWKFCRTNL